MIVTAKSLVSAMAVGYLVGVCHGYLWVLKPPPKVVSEGVGLPYDKAVRWGGGGGKPFKINTGFFAGLLVGGAKRSQVYGRTHHPITWVSNNTLPWGFLPLDMNSLGISNLTEANPYIYYNLPQNTTRPGGQVVEMNITTPGTLDLPFYFVSDLYTAGEVAAALTWNCSIAQVYISDPVPFNLTGDIQPRSVVQFYRGDTAAILLRDYDSSKEITDSPYLVPNPPFPSSVNETVWGCMNYTIGNSIPLMGVPHNFPDWAVTLYIIAAFVVLCCGCYCCCYVAGWANEYSTRAPANAASNRNRVPKLDRPHAMVPKKSTSSDKTLCE